MTLFNAAGGLYIKCPGLDYGYKIIQGSEIVSLNTFPGNNSVYVR